MIDAGQRLSFLFELLQHPWIFQVLVEQYFEDYGLVVKPAIATKINNTYPATAELFST